MANVRRDLDKERFWRGVVRRHAASGLSARAFCRREKLGEPSFYAWRRTIRERDAAAIPTKRGRDAEAKRSGGPRPAFVPLLMSERSLCEASIVIELAGGRTLRLPESIPAQRLAEVVHAIETHATQTRATATGGAL